MTPGRDMLRGRSAIVTGSTSGIGLGIARTLARSGANVTLNGFGDAHAIEALRSALGAEHGVRVEYSPADMTRPAEIEHMVRVAEQTFGGVDILVNNAGIQHVAPVVEFPPDKWEAILAVNLSSAFYATRACLPGMLQRGWGRIVNIASAHGLVASPFKSAYISAKHGLVGLTKTVALETAETAITCNAVCPGFVKTPLVEGQIRDQAKLHRMAEDQVVRDVILASQPSKRFVEIDAVAEFVLFLCSDAGSGMTGSAVSIDGGWTAR